MTTETTTIGSLIQATGQREQVLAAITKAAQTQSWTIGKFIDGFTDSKMEGYLMAFRDLTFKDVADAVSGASKASKAPKTSVPAVENFKDETVRADFDKSVVALLETEGLAEGRGLTPIAIRTKLGKGSEIQMRESLSALVTSGKLVSTGKTKGLKYVVTKHRAAAEAKFQEEDTARKKAEEDKKAAATSGDAKPAKGAKPAK